jgi:hypothetical protein
MNSAEVRNEQLLSRYIADMLLRQPVMGRVNDLPKKTNLVKNQLPSRTVWLQGTPCFTAK